MNDPTPTGNLNDHFHLVYSAYDFHGRLPTGEARLQCADPKCELAALRAENERLLSERNNLRANLQLVSALTSSAADLTRPHDPSSSVSIYPEARRPLKEAGP